MKLLIAYAINTKEVKVLPRPRKCRKVCRLPENDGFLPVKQSADQLPVILGIDEYETLRLIDREGFSQEQCGEYMHVARATVQQIYTSARKKLADALVEGRPIQISGGDYLLCEGKEQGCDCGGCVRHRSLSFENQGEKKMKIAIPLDENQEEVCSVLARAPFFLFWEEGATQVVDNPAAQAFGGAGMQVAQFLIDSEVSALVTPRCGQNAADVFKAANVTVYESASKIAAEDLAACVEGQLQELTQFHGGFNSLQ